MALWERNGAIIGCMGAALLIGLPVGGVFAWGMSIAPYMEFPPRTLYVEHAPFSWTAFLILGVTVAAIFLPFLVRLTQAVERGVPTPWHVSFPWWGWIGAAVIFTSWILAWNRFSWFDEFQAYTFFPLWAGYILVVNGLTMVRTGRCPMLSRLGFFTALFPLSAVFWWCFEYLNRFVHNWHYLGIGDLGPWQYFLNATLSFSTVLPAVIGTAELLKSFPNRFQSLTGFFPLKVRHNTRWGWTVLICVATALAGIGIRPDYLFPLLWIAPLLIITSIQVIVGEKTVFSSLKHGDWRPIVVPALAALICGFFWEMWNYNSLAHWEYSVPFVQRFQVFEMPVLGYAGYLPFGLECVVVANLLRNRGVPI